MVERIHKLSGAPGLAIGVYHHGQIVHEDYRSSRDVEAQLPVDKDTIFRVASLTKANTAIAIGILVGRSKLQWETPVEDILPFLKEHQSEKSKLSVADILSHPTGTTWGNALCMQSNNIIMIPKREGFRTFQYLQTVAEPRSQFIYNNHAYNIPRFMTEHLSGQKYDDVVKDNIFDPLGMTRTFTENRKDASKAAPYNISSDGSPFRIPFLEASAERLNYSAVRTTITRILRLYSAFLKRLKPLVPTIADGSTIHAGGANMKTTSSNFQADSNPIKQAEALTQPYISLPSPTIFSQSSALRWMRTQPSEKLDFGWNSANVPSMSLFGRGYPVRLALWHRRNMPGTTPTVILLPETETAVVLMQNSLGLCDAAGLIAQLLMDCLFLRESQYDYVALAKEAVQNGRSRMERVSSYGICLTMRSSGERSTADRTASTCSSSSVRKIVSAA